jgi:hypothetical protein
MPRGNEAKAIAALFRRAFRPRPDPLDVERRVVHKLVNRALARREQRQVRQILRAAFARLIGELSENGWMRGGDGTCSECASELPRHSFWSKLRPHYVTCPRGHGLHIECVHLRTVDGKCGVEAACPRCLGG